MGLGGSTKKWLNRGLRPLGVRLESLAAEKAELARLLRVDASGQFSRAVFPLLDSFSGCAPEAVLELVRKFKSERTPFLGDPSPTSFSYANDYFSSPDAEVAYSIVRQFAPRAIVEVGSGNSTRLLKAAIEAGGLATELISVDPAPRVGVTGAADLRIAERVEELDPSFIPGKLGPGDILFVDSSHQVELGNDVLALLLGCFPRLRAGVLIHVHDIFLPFDYPREWIIDSGWRMGEQYLVHALLMDSPRYEVLWAGHYFQRSLPDFAAHFDLATPARASSLWLRSRY